MTKKALIGGFSTLIVGLIVCITSILFFFQNYFSILKGFFDSGKGPSTVLQVYQQPIFTQITFISGLMLIVAAYGYFINRKWSFTLGIIATVIGLWTTWMLAMFPLMIGMAPLHMLNFLLVAVAFFIILILEKTERKILLTSFVFGMAYVMTFMNGNASLQKIIGTSLMLKKTATAPTAHIAFLKMNDNAGLIYDAIQLINWLGALLFAIVCVAVLFRKDWVLPVAILASLISIVAGSPVAYLDSVATSTLSMFSYGPIIAFIVLIALLVFREKLWSEEKLSFGKKIAQKVTSKA